jgi:GAF domain-containing protein
LAREAPRPLPANMAEKDPVTIDAEQFPLVQRVLMNSSGLLLSDTRQEKQWRSPKGSIPVRSWLCVPLVVSHLKLGILSIGHSVPNSFNDEHLRLARSLAIPASAAIQNARLYQCAKIYGSELEKRAQLQDLTIALERLPSGRAS